MKTLKTTTGIWVLFASLAIVSCKNKENTPEAQPMQGEMHQEKMNKSMNDENGQEFNDPLVANYIKLKNALTSDDNKEAERAGGSLLVALKSFDASKYPSDKQKELKDIIADASEQAEHISESPIHHQREHFSTLSQDMADLLAITGTKDHLYQQYCPMYNNGKGAIWISETKEIKNPYFGSKMMDCGTVQKEF